MRPTPEDRDPRDPFDLSDDLETDPTLIAGGES